MTGILMMSVGNSYGSLPVNTVAPVVSGTATVGQTLSTTNGTWTGAPAPTFTYQWQRNTTNIGGATSSTYVLVSADAGNTVRCVVTATNAVGIASANSNSTATVIAPGQIEYTSPGTYTYIPAAGITSVSVVCVGGGGAAGSAGGTPRGGGGGALAFKNNITVVPGVSYTVVVGNRGLGSNSSGLSTSGGASTFTASFGTCTAGGGVRGFDVPGAGGSPSGSFDGGGSGGTGGQINLSTRGGGGGAGGYSGNGGNGGNGSDVVRGNGGNGSGGGGGGGGAGNTPGAFGNTAAGGGGVGLLGQGASGAGGTGSFTTASTDPVTGGGGGSGGGNGSRQISYNTTDPVDNAGNFGGGSGAANSGPGNAAVGAVRIIWPGTTRQFPSTNTGNL